MGVNKGQKFLPPTTPFPAAFANGFPRLYGQLIYPYLQSTLAKGLGKFLSPSGFFVGVGNKDPRLGHGSSTSLSKTCNASSELLQIGLDFVEFQEITFLEEHRHTWARLKLRRGQA